MEAEECRHRGRFVRLARREVTRRAAEKTKDVSDFLCTVAQPFADQWHFSLQIAVQTDGNGP